MWQILVRALLIGSVMGLAIVLVEAGSRAVASEPGLPVVSTTLPSTTLPPLITTTTLPSVTLPPVTTTLAAAPTEATLPGSGDETTAPGEVGGHEDSGTHDFVSGEIGGDGLSFCGFVFEFLDADLPECSPGISGTTHGEPGPGAIQSGTDEGPESPRTKDEQEEEEEEESEQESAAPEDEASEEPSSDLLQRLLDLVDELLNRGDTEVAGTQLLATTGLAVLPLAAIAIALLLAGLRTLSGGSGEDQ